MNHPTRAVVQVALLRVLEWDAALVEFDGT
jgi:hypothetical protein